MESSQQYGESSKAYIPNELLVLIFTHLTDGFSAELGSFHELPPRHKTLKTKRRAELVTMFYETLTALSLTTKQFHRLSSPFLYWVLPMYTGPCNPMLLRTLSENYELCLEARVLVWDGWAWATEEQLKYVMIQNC